MPYTCAFLGCNILHNTGSPGSQVGEILETSAPLSGITEQKTMTRELRTLLSGLSAARTPAPLGSCFHLQSLRGAGQGGPQAQSKGWAALTGATAKGPTAPVRRLFSLALCCFGWFCFPGALSVRATDSNHLDNQAHLGAFLGPEPCEEYGQRSLLLQGLAFVSSFR